MSTKRKLCCLLQTGTRDARAWEVPEMPEGKPIAQDQKSEVSQEGTPFSRSNYPQKHHRALAGILLLTESKAGHFANVRERHMTLNDLEFLVHCTRVCLPLDPLTFTVCVIC